MGAVITLPLASSGYGEQDRRPIWLAPVKQVMMAPRVLHDDDGSQPLTKARRRQQGSDSPDICLCPLLCGLFFFWKGAKGELSYKVKKTSLSLRMLESSY